MLLNIIIFSLFLLCSCMRGMEQPPAPIKAPNVILPADIIRKIAACIPGASNWSDTHQTFGLQSIALVNRHWHQSMSSLSNQDFPYLFPL